MSVGGKTVPISSGILRRTPSRGKINQMNLKQFTNQVGVEKDHLGSPISGTRVHFAVPSNLSDLLSSAVSTKDDKYVDKKVEEEIQGLITHLRNARGEGLISWLQEIEKNMSYLKPKMENFVLSILNIGWADQTEQVAASYNDFLVNLVTAQGYYIKPVMKMLIANLSGLKGLNAYGTNEQQKLREIELSVFDKTHTAIKAILKVVPLASQRALIHYIQECQPYFLTPNTHLHTNYVKNILSIADYDSQKENGGRLVILCILMERLVQLDATVDNKYDDMEETVKSEVDTSIAATAESSFRKPDNAANLNLNAAMVVLFSYLHENLNSQQSHISEMIYKNFLKCFEIYVMPAVGTCHVQFLLFYIVSSKPTLSDGFLKWLWTKFISPSTSSIMRQTSMAYISGFVSRAVCVTKGALLVWLQKICNWIHSYIDQSLNSSCATLNIHAHAPFYAACQAVFYMFVFRIEEVKDSKVAIEKISKLNFQKVITSHLNPLRFCAPAIARSFSAVTNYYQLAYCETILMKNERLHLPIVRSMNGISENTNIVTPEFMHSFFPFDPYSLRDTRSFIDAHYRECKGSIYDEADDSSSDEDWLGQESEEEGFTDIAESCDKELYAVKESEKMQQNPKRKRLASSCSSVSKAKIQEFGYSSFPGFKQ